MKIVYLRNSENNWKRFQYEGELKDLLSTLNTGISIGENLYIGNSVHINNNVIIGDNVIIQDSVFIGEGATIGDSTELGYKVFIDGGAKIGIGVDIANEIVVGIESIIENGVSLTKGLLINGSKHTLNYVGNGKISICCQTETIAWFKENYQQLGIENGYSEAEINEYYVYILMAEQFYNSL